MSLFETTPIPLAAQIACVEREIAMRERVYPRWVSEKRMPQKKADDEMAAMRAVLRTLRGIAEAPDPISQALNEGDGTYRP